MALLLFCIFYRDFNLAVAAISCWGTSASMRQGAPVRLDNGVGCPLPFRWISGANSSFGGRYLLPECHHSKQKPEEDSLLGLRHFLYSHIKKSLKNL